MVDAVTKKTLGQIPLLKTRAGPRDGDLWVQRLKEEYQSLIAVSKQYLYISDWIGKKYNCKYNHRTRYSSNQNCWYSYSINQFHIDKKKISDAWIELPNPIPFKISQS